MGFQLAGRWAVITGASAGIGKAIAEECASRGCHLIIVARRLDRLQELAKSLSAKHGVSVKPIAMDLSEPGAAEALAEQVRTDPVSIVINNAGFGTSHVFPENDPKTLSTMVDLNIRFLMLFTHAMLPRLVKCDAARVMNVGSIAGYQGVPNFVAYAGTKGFVNNFTEGLAWEYAGSTVKFTCLQPGGTKTEFFDVADMTGSSFAKGGMSAQRVATLGVDAMVKGKERIVTGLLNKASVAAQRFLPRFVTRMTLRHMFKDLA